MDQRALAVGCLGDYDLAVLDLQGCRAASRVGYYHRAVCHSQIEARLDTSEHYLYANQNLRYFNNSPDTLKFVCFHLYPNAYRDRKNQGAKKTLTLAATEFIRRFLLHVVPKAYVRIRHFGFLASRAKARDLPRCRQLLGLAPKPPLPENKTTHDLLVQLTGTDLTLCPHCQQGPTRFLTEPPPPHPLRRNPSPRLPGVQDTS